MGEPQCHLEGVDLPIYTPQVSQWAIVWKILVRCVLAAVDLLNVYGQPSSPGIACCSTQDLGLYLSWSIFLGLWAFSLTPAHWTAPSGSPSCELGPRAEQQNQEPRLELVEAFRPGDRPTCWKHRSDLSCPSVRCLLGVRRDDGSFLGVRSVLVSGILGAMKMRSLSYSGHRRLNRSFQREPGELM